MFATEYDQLGNSKSSFHVGPDISIIIFIENIFDVFHFVILS